MHRERLRQASARLGEAAIDPRVWPEIMEQISNAAGARGAILLQGASRTPDVPLSYAVGRLVLEGMTNALQLVRQAALALDRSGAVLGMNPAAEQIFDDEFRVTNRRIFLRDKKARSALESFIQQMQTMPDTAALPVAPIVVHRQRKRPLIIQILPVDGAARTPFLGAHALLALSDLDFEAKPDSTTFAKAFGLSRAETALASLLGTGLSPRQAAERLGVTYETVRTQLKAIFAKTGVHRQSELVALLTRPIIK